MKPANPKKLKPVNPVTNHSTFSETAKLLDLKTDSMTEI